MGKTREKEHRAFLAWLRQAVEERQAQALVVTGDVFDTGTPPSYARSLYNDFIVSLQETCCTQVIILGGNHDSAATLNEGKTLLAWLKTRVIAGLSPDLEDHLIPVCHPDGQPGLIICALPFLRPSDLVQSAGGQSGREKIELMGQAIAAVYADLYGRAQVLGERLEKETGCPPLPVMVTGHLTVVGAVSSESVRDIYIGSLSGFPASGFPPAAYTALGHLHRPQGVNGGTCIRYSGSPIPLSFDEASQAKEVIQADFLPGQPVEITPVPVPCFRSLVSLKGSLKTIAGDLETMARDGQASQTRSQIRSQIKSRTWLEAEVAEDDFLSDLTERVQAMVDEAGLGNMELLRVRRQRKGPGPGLAPEAVLRLEELTPREVFRRRLDQETLAPDREEELTRLFEQILEQVTAPSGEEQP